MRPGDAWPMLPGPRRRREIVSAAAQTAAKGGDGGSRRIHKPSRSDVELAVCADRTLEVLGGRWKVHLLVFMARGIHRHGRLLECLPGASKKVMTEALRALERDGLVGRRVFAEVPPRVEYWLTPLGWTIAEPLMALSDWGQAHAGEVEEARSRFRAASRGR
jgi:DNA-binding HxlR family transcriptional regulator